MNRIPIFLIIFSIISTNVFSQEEGNSYTLPEIIEIAMNQNLDVLSSKALITASNSSIKSAFGSYLPNVSYTMGYSRQLNTAGGQTVNVGGQIIPLGETPPNSYNMGVSAGMYLFDGFNREANFTSAQTNFEKAKLSFEQTKNFIKINVIRKYFDYALKKQVVEFRKDNLDKGKKELESIKAKNEVGQIPITIVYSKEADLGSLELELAKSENDLNLSRVSLLSFIGLEPIQNADFVTEIERFKTDETEIQNFRKSVGNYQDAVKNALKNRKDYQASLKSLEYYNAQTRIARSYYFPKLQLGGGWSWSNNEFVDFSNKGRSYIGLNLSVPIFDGFATNTQIQFSEYNYKVQEYQKINLERTIATEIEQAFLNLEASEKQIKIAEKSAFASEMNLKVLQERFNVGTASIMDLITANNLYINSKINYISSLYYYLLAQKDIEYFIGN